MASGTSFEDRFAANDLTIEEASHVKDAVELAESVGIATVTKAKGEYFVLSVSSDDSLVISNNEARDLFLELLEKNYGGELGIHSEAALRRALEKDD